MTPETRKEIQATTVDGTIRFTRVLDALGIRRSGWYYAAVAPEARKRPGPAPKPIPAPIVEAVVSMAT